MDKQPAETSISSTTGRTAGAVRIIGVDPGLQRTGYAVVECGSVGADGSLVEAGVIRLTVRASLEARLLELSENLDQILSHQAPRILACEQLYAHYKHPRTAILMGHARGVILALAARRGLRVLDIASTHVKRTMTGNGHAGKVQMQRAVAAALRLAKLPEPHDVADAIAIAVCGVRLSAAELRGPQ